MLMICVSDTFMVETEYFIVLQNKIFPVLAQGIYIYVGHSLESKMMSNVTRTLP